MHAVFRRADQVDDTIVKSKADHRVEIGEDARGGDRGLELHEFVEALVMLGLQLANPKFGEVGHNYAVEVDAGVAFATLMSKHVLANAKRDGLALVKEEINTSAEMCAIFAFA